MTAEMLNLKITVMKTKMNVLAAALVMVVAALCSCSQDGGNGIGGDGDGDVAVVSFALANDEGTEGSAVSADGTRAGLVADGKAMTDLWVFDFVDGKETGMVHLGSGDDLAKVSMSLRYGEHVLCFVASRGSDATVDKAAHTIVWGKFSDTFYKRMALTVDRQTGAQSVELERVASRLRLTVADELPSDVGRIAVKTGQWFSGIDYLTGDAAGREENKTLTAEIPADMAGTAGVSVAFFAAGGDWTTWAMIQALDADGKAIGSGNVTDVEMGRGVSANCTGRLFGGSLAIGVALSDVWRDASYELQ